LADGRFIGIDLFAGAGGLSYGLSLAGFDMRLAIEVDPYCASTLMYNQKKTKVIVSDIRLLDPLDVVAQANIRPEKISILAGGPPCQGFSDSNRRTRSLDNPLNKLYIEFFRFVKALSPPVFLLENVEGLKTLGNGIVLQSIVELGQKLGYNVQWKIVNAQDCGAPQRRRRIIFIGAKMEMPTAFVFKTAKPTTVKQAIDDLPILENGNRVDPLPYSRNTNLSSFQKLMRKSTMKKVSNNYVTKNNSLVQKRYQFVPQGGNWSNIPPELMFNYTKTSNCHRWIYHRLMWNKVSVPINNYRKNMLIHPEQNRGLSVREAARLQTVTDDYVFLGTLASQQQQVTNLVPPLMAESIGSNILRELEVRHWIR
jgi:DNA (cytosine-5)-methyltransferase 1